MGEKPGFATLYRISDFFSKYLRDIFGKLGKSGKRWEKEVRNVSEEV